MDTDMFNTKEEYNTIMCYYFANIYLLLKTLLIDIDEIYQDFSLYILILISYLFMKHFLQINDFEEKKMYVVFVMSLFICDSYYYFIPPLCKLN
tara:strand:- start:370 stop:651 length:282 start_codon:yes stop_codon:yes gene_type:complete